MKLHRWVVWALVVTFLASEVFLFSALRQKEAAQTSFQMEKQRTADLQSQLDSLKDANAGSQTAEIARLRADNQDLPRLRNQVTQLLAANSKFAAANQKLTEQLKATAAYAQQQQAQLQEMAAENQQANAIVQQPDAATARNACINNLRQIDAAKQMWALEKNKTVDAMPTAQDLLPFFKDGTFPVCPSGGTYTINVVGELPTCSIPGHALPQQ
jgi:hypothetical protein